MDFLPPAKTIKTEIYCIKLSTTNFIQPTSEENWTPLLRAAGFDLLLLGGGLVTISSSESIISVTS